MKPNIVFIVSIFIIGLHLTACDKEEDKILLDPNGVVVRQPHLWKSPISDNNRLAEITIGTPIIHSQSSVLVGGQKAGQSTIMSINSLNGKMDWQWNDLLGLIDNPDYKDPVYIVRKTYHLNNNKLFFNYSTSSYCIDVSSGATLWKYKTLRSRTSNNAGIDDVYFSSGSQYEPLDDEKIYWGNLNSSDEEQLLLIPDYTMVENAPINAQGGLNSLKPFKINGDTYLAFGIENPYVDFTQSGWGLTELNLYNITKSKYVYKKVVINPQKETRVIADLFYQDPNLYFQSANYIHCHEAMTGKEIWRRYLGTAPLTSRMLLADNKLFSACEDRVLYCVDALTGQMLWKEQNTGTCSELSYLNGVLYYLGGGDGLLHAVDANTGKHLWKVSSPDLKSNNDAWFFGVCIAVPGRDGEKGVVVATTGLHAYGYDAIR